MTPGEFREYAKAMRDFGMSEATINGCTLKMAYNLASSIAEVSPVALTPAGMDAEKDEDPIKHKVEELASLMKLNDIDLVDRLFPEDQEEESA